MADKPGLIEQRLYIGYYEDDFEALLSSIYETMFNWSFIRINGNITENKRYLRVFGDNYCYGFVDAIQYPSINPNCVFLLTGFSDAIEFLSEQLEDGFPRNTGNILTEISNDVSDRVKYIMNINFNNFLNCRDKHELETLTLQELSSL